METSMRLPAVNSSAVQSLSQTERTGSSRMTQDRQEASAPQAQSSVQVSISAEARAAEQAASLRATPAEPQGPTAQPQAVSPASTAQPVRELESAAATSAAPEAQPNSASQTGMRASEERSEGESGSRDQRAQDAASATNRPAMEMYLENSSRPSSQAAPSTVRASA